MTSSPHLRSYPGPLITRLCLILIAGSLSFPIAGLAQDETKSGDLVKIFELGQMVADTNGDSIPDFVQASLVMGATPSTAEIAAGAEISSRLGFETMAMDLPMSRGDGGLIPIVIGRSGLSIAGITTPGLDPTSLDSGEGAVAVVESDDRVWVLVIGGDDDGLLAAARLFSGVLPHTRTLSTAPLSQVREDLEAALQVEDLNDTSIRISQARARNNQDGITRLIVDVTTDDPLAAANAFDFLTTIDGVSPTGYRKESDSTEDEHSPSASNPLDYPGLASVEVRISGGPAMRLPGRAAPDRPGPISARPGTGAKDNLDLSNLYTAEGLLGGSPIPNRVDAVLVPGMSGLTGLPELGARLGLESTGLTVPLVHPSGSIKNPESRPTMILAGKGNHLTDQLSEDGRIDLNAIETGGGLIQIVPDAFGSKSAIVITGGDDAGAERALHQVAMGFPHLGERGKDRPTVNDVERELWDALSGHTPLGQAATGMYKLNRIGQALQDEDIVAANILMSVEKAAEGLDGWVESRAINIFGTDQVEVQIDNRDVLNASTKIYEEAITFPSEVARFHALMSNHVYPSANGRSVRIEARLSEPPEVRTRLANETHAALIEAGANPDGTEVVILSAFKQGYSWLYDVIRPRIEGQEIGEIEISFLRNDPPEEWPQQAIHTPVRWLHEIFPIDEVLARDLGLELDQISFEEVMEGPIYTVRVTDREGSEILSEIFEPHYVMRPYFDRFEDYEKVRVTTGWLRAQAEGDILVDQRIATDPETFWDHFQATVLPRMYDHVMDLHDGLPRGGSSDSPFFGELIVELEMSEPDFRLGVDNEIHAPMDALHEEIYFGTIEFFDMLGRNSRGQGIQFPGRIVPVMRPKGDGTAPTAEISVTGFATSRPAVVVSYETTDGTHGQERLDIPKTSLARPSARMARVKAGQSGVSHLALRVPVDTDRDMRDSLIMVAREQSVDERMVSAEMVAGVAGEIEALREAGMYQSELAWKDLGTIELWAEWTHEQDPESRRTAFIRPNGAPLALPDWRTLLPETWSYEGDRIVQWDTPIPPAEGDEMLAKMAEAFPEATMYRAGRSYLGRDIWAMDLMPEIRASHWSHTKATTFKPTVIFSARQHANEVSSTSHVLRHAELLLTDPDQSLRLRDVNVVIHPFLNPDGAQTAYDLYRITPDYILHAGYLGPLGQDATSGGEADHPIYPESTVRDRLWKTWLPDIFLNPHGYPSHQVVQLFSEFSGLVRRGRVTERNWGFNKGWFMPGFGYVDSPEYPRHKDAAFTIREYITRGINSNRDVHDLNQRAYARYERYGARYDPDVYNLPMTDSVLIEMPLKGSSGNGSGYDPDVTIWSGITEAPDETAYGPWMELMGKAGLSWDQAITDYLYDGDHTINRSGSLFFGGVTLRMNRPRPPEKSDDQEEQENGPPAEERYD